MILDSLYQPIHRTLTRTTDATLEPIELDEAKEWLRISDNYENASLRALITTARQQVEHDTGLALMTQTWRYSLDAIPAGGTIVLPIGPVSSVTSIAAISAAEVSSTIATSVYRLDDSGLPARIVLKDNQSWTTDVRPENGYTVTFVAGFGATPDDVPQPLRHAMRLLLEHWHWRKEQGRPPAYDALIGPYTMRLAL